MSRIYLASSWRNQQQPALVAYLRLQGHEVYDFRNPAPGEHGFQWSAIDEDWKKWSADKFRESLRHPIAQAGWRLDAAGMEWADTCVLALPCGRSAHLEAGLMAGQGKRVVVFLGELTEPELMYLSLGPEICVSLTELKAVLS